MKMPKLRPLCRLSRLVLHIELPLILLQALAALVAYLYLRVHDLALALRLYPRIIPFLPIPLIIALFTALLIERLQKE